MFKYFGIILLVFGTLYPLIYYRKRQSLKMQELEKYIKIVNNCSINTEFFGKTLPEIVKESLGGNQLNTTKEDVLEKLEESSVPEEAKKLLCEYFTSFGVGSYYDECKKAKTCLERIKAIAEGESTKQNKNSLTLCVLVCALAVSGVILLI